MFPVHRRTLILSVALACVLCCYAGRAGAQFFDPDFGNDVPGVWIEQDGNVRSRQVDPDKQLAAIRARAKSAAAAAKDEKLSFVSLPKLFAEARESVAAGKPIPDELRYLGGLTQVRYVFVYAEEKDLVIAGPSEPWKVHAEGLYATGRRSGRPVMQLDDLVVAMRTAGDRRGHVFGCRIDPDPKSVEISKEVMTRFARKPRRERMDAIAKALGPQKVSVFGTAADTRFAFVCVAADYKLKRFALGLEPAAQAAGGVGHAVDNTRSAMNRFWFETSFEPLRVSPDGNAYEIRGRRVLVKAGAFSFDPRGATPKAMDFAKRFTDRVAALAVAEPLVAELQNVADLSLLATLIRHDNLDRKVAWDTSWLMNDGGASDAFPVKNVPVPVTADTLVSATGGSIAAGGVLFSPAPWVTQNPRERDETGDLSASRQQVTKLRRRDGTSGAVVSAP